MIWGQTSDCILCMHVVHHFQKDTHRSALFNIISQLPPQHLQSSPICTQNDDVVADSYWHLFSQLIIDTVHKPLPPHHLITWQMTLNTLAQCSWAALHLCLARSRVRLYTHIIALVLLSSQFWSYETSVNPPRISKKYLCSILLIRHLLLSTINYIYCASKLNNRTNGKLLM